MKALRPLVPALLALLAACGESSDAAPGASSKSEARAPAKGSELTVFAATSLREALGEVDALYEKEHAGTTITLNFGASNALAQQIVSAHRGDVFVSADEAQMDVVEKASLVAAGTRAQLLSNQLVVVQPKPLPEGVPAIERPETLADPAIARLSLGNPDAVPAGKYAKSWLTSLDLWSQVEARVVPGVDVRAALAAVESGGAQAGIVYATDAIVSHKVRVALRVPLEEGPKITYPVAALSCAADVAAAKAFVDFLHGADARAIFEKRGFLVAPATAGR